MLSGHGTVKSVINQKKKCAGPRGGEPPSEQGPTPTRALWALFPGSSAPHAPRNCLIARGRQCCLEPVGLVQVCL